MSGVYGRIFAATSKRMASAGRAGAPPVSPLALWAVPGGVFATWMIWEALSQDIKESVGLYIDPDRVVNRVQAEKDQRLAVREAAKAPPPSAVKADPVVVEEEEEEEEEEVVSHEEIAATVQAVVEQSGGDDDNDDSEEEEEEAPKPKKIKKKAEDMTNEEMWESFNESAMVATDDDDDVSTNQFQVLFLNFSLCAFV